jgi:hypothetical protein
MYSVHNIDRCKRCQFICNQLASEIQILEIQVKYTFQCYDLMVTQVYEKDWNK